MTFLTTVFESGSKDMRSAYEMFSWYKYLIVSLVFSHLGFWSGSLFLIASFPDLCLLVLFFLSTKVSEERSRPVVLNTRFIYGALFLELQIN